MIKKLSLYGLGLGVAFGYPTQAKLEEFLASQGDKIEVTREKIGRCSFPQKLILKDDKAQEAWKKFSTGTAESSEKGAAAYVDYFLTSKKRTKEEQRTCFWKCSRWANTEECTLAAKWSVKKLRIIDFDSIVEGLIDETQKAAARYLIQKGNEVELLAAVDQWVDERFVEDKYPLRVFIVGNEEPVDWLTYTLNLEVIDAFKAPLKTTLKGMLRCKSTRETLVLSLVLLKDLKFKISSCGVYYGMNTIEFQSYGHEIVDIQGVCHELNHALHDFLGIEGFPYTHWCFRFRARTRIISIGS